jgi:hypothetical protein
MRITALVTAGALAFLPGRSEAQVSGAVVIGGGPVGGVVVFGRPQVVVQRHPRVIVIDRYDRHKHNHRKFERRVVYYDRGYDRYFDHYRPGLIEVAVLFGGGHYYRDFEYDDYHRNRARARYRDRRDFYRDWDRRGDWDRWERGGWDRDRDRDRDGDRDRNRDRDGRRGRDRSGRNN